MITSLVSLLQVRIRFAHSWIRLVKPVLIASVLRDSESVIWMDAGSYLHPQVSSPPSGKRVGCRVYGVGCRCWCSL